MRAQGHQVLNFTVTLAGLLAMKDKPGLRPLPHPLVAAPLSAALASLPDLLEPAVTPHHRQAFHSVTLGLTVGAATYKAYKWEPQTPGQEILRALALIAGSAYLLHLVGDMMTPKGLPLIGR